MTMDAEPKLDAILACLRGEEPPDRSRYFNELANYDYGPMDGAGSCNHQMLEAALELFQDLPSRNAAFAWWLGYFRRSHTRFMEREVFSRIYAEMQVVPVLTAYHKAIIHGDKDIEQRAHDWLRAFWSYCALAAEGWPLTPRPPEPAGDPEGVCVTLCGARSFCFRKEGNQYLDTTHHIAQWSVDHAFAWLVGQSYPTYTPIVQAISVTGFGITDGERRAIKDAWMDLDMGPIFPFIESHLPMVPFEFWSTANGQMTVCLEHVPKSTSTDPIAAFISHESGSYSYHSLDDGYRKGATDYRAAVHIGNDGRPEKVVIEAVKEDRGISVHDMPRGAVAYGYRIGPDGITDLTGDEVVDPPDPPDEEVTPETILMLLRRAERNCNRGDYERACQRVTRARKDLEFWWEVNG